MVCLQTACNYHRNSELLINVDYRNGQKDYIGLSNQTFVLEFKKRSPKAKQNSEEQTHKPVTLLLNVLLNLLFHSRVFTLILNFEKNVDNNLKGKLA